MKSKDLRTMDRANMQSKVDEMKKDLLKLQAQIAVGASIKNPGEVKKIKKTLARIYTIQKERETEAAKKQASTPKKAEAKPAEKPAAKKETKTEEKAKQ